MFSLSSNTVSLDASLPKSIKANGIAYSGGSQHSVDAFKLSASPPKYSKSQVSRSRSSSPLEVVQDELSTPSPPSSPPAPHHSEERSATSSIEAERAIVLPACAYNYQPYKSPSPPAVLPWTRRKLYEQVFNIASPVFLSCNLTNPVHLASILTHGCSWGIVEQVAEGMAPAVNYDFVKTEDFRGRRRVQGVLLGGLVPEAMELLEAVMRRRYGPRYRRSVKDVMVELEHGNEADVAAYVYWEA